MFVECWDTTKNAQKVFKHSKQDTVLQNYGLADGPTKTHTQAPTPVSISLWTPHKTNCSAVEAVFWQPAM